jgi:Toprim domain
MLMLPICTGTLYIARDADAAGDMALVALTERAEAAGVEALALSPRSGDFNEDLCALGPGALRSALRIQLAPQDVACFMRLSGISPQRADLWGRAARGTE